LKFPTIGSTIFPSSRSELKQKKGLAPEQGSSPAGGDESFLNPPLDFKLDSQSNIYVMDWGDVEIKVFKPRPRDSVPCPGG
jgi:hypothetical protein